MGMGKEEVCFRMWSGPEGRPRFFIKSSSDKGWLVGLSQYLANVVCQTAIQVVLMVT